jgi:hypothetical protein
MNVRLIAIVAVVGLVLYLLFKGQGASASPATAASVPADAGDNVSALFQGVTATPTGVPIAPVSSAARVTLPGNFFGPINPSPLPGPAQPVRIFQPVIAAPVSKYVPPPIVLNKLFFSGGSGGLN